MVVSPAAKALGEAYHIKCHPDWRSFTPQTTNQSLVAIHLHFHVHFSKPQPPETSLSYLLLLPPPLPPRKKKKGWSHPALLDYTRLATTAVPAGGSVARDSGKTEVLATMLVRDVGWGDKQGERFTPGPGGGLIGF